MSTTTPDSSPLPSRPEPAAYLAPEATPPGHPTPGPVPAAPAGLAAPAGPLAPGRPHGVGRSASHGGHRPPSFLTARAEKPTLAQRTSLVALLLGTGVLYLWNLGINGWGNAFYAAAIQAGSQDWTAFLFGSSDAGNSITVDKPPASLWIPALSVRIFGLSSWSILVPEALMGVASVWLLYATVSRVSGRWAGLVAGAALATTPVALLMFRYDNPEALLILLTVAACYATVRAVQASTPAAAEARAAAAANRPRWRRPLGPVGWLVLTGVFIGFGFLTKQLQAVVVVPTLALAYLLAARVGWGKRILHLLAAAAAMVVSAGWWVALVELWPAGSRPYIGGSQNNSFLELTFGYNGLGRLNGDEDGSVGNQWGTPGLLRLVSGNYVSQISWLLPAAALLMIAALVMLVRSRAWRSDAGRARIGAFIALAGWLVVEGLTISLMQGITHEYYTAILAAPVAGVAAIGAAWLWESGGWGASITLGSAVVVAAATGWWALASAGWGTWIGGVATLLAVLAGLGLALRPLLRRGDGVEWDAPVGYDSPLSAASLPDGAGAASSRTRPSAARRWAPRLLAGFAGAAVIGALGAQSAFAASTTSVAKTGSIVYAGPTDRMGMGGRGGGPGGQGGFGGQRGGTGGPGTQGGQGGTPPAAPGGQGSSQGSTGQGSTGQGSSTQGTTGGGGFGGSSERGGTGGAGGLLGASTPGDEIVKLLQENAGDYRWVAATTGSQNAAGYQLAAQASVMPIGGFNGTDPSPTLEQFQEYVKQGEIHYYIASGSGMGGGRGGSDGTASQISSWVAENYTATTVDGVTVYDLTQPAN
ncbi:MAG: glycosyltransferase family 39 protein [Arthrobacter sp.]|jgi:4-amino-4-deoxy-L-arabinose transferase-like glycosyltransferase|nr:glycosyltransferase family 39 protein [Arthrobacter sp.]